MKDLSILIPSFNEPYLKNTINDIKKHAETDIEILVGDDSKEHLGQRAMTRKLAKMAAGKYIAKCDAHNSFAQGFDRILLEDMKNDIAMTPMLATLDVEDWRIVPKPITSRYCFDTELRFQYCEDKDPEGQLVETMALQGSFYLMDRKKFLDLDICDVKLGSWGFQGVETAIKVWLSGGSVLTNKNTFYGHYFRNKSTGEQRYTEESAKKVQDKMKKIFLNKDLARLIEKFNYPADWTLDKVKQLCT